MEVTKRNFQVLDINFILTHGTAVSSQESTADITPIGWSDDVLNGKYENKTIIKTKDEKGN